MLLPLKLSSLLLILLTAPLLTIAQVTSTNQALFPGLRITSHTPKPASAVLSALYNEIGPAPAPTTRLSQLVSSITGFDAANKQRFIAGLEAILGKVGFTIIAQITYDTWFPLFGVNTSDADKGLILRRVVLGNPLRLVNNIAPYDIPAVMFAPLEIVIRELPGNGGTDIIYNKPSSMVTILEAGPVNYTKLIEETLILDRLLADLTTLISKS